MFTITWEKTETHSAKVSAERLAELLGVAVEEIDPANPAGNPCNDIEDTLAEIEGDDTFDGCSRGDVEITDVGIGA